MRLKLLVVLLALALLPCSCRLSKRGASGVAERDMEMSAVVPAPAAPAEVAPASYQTADASMPTTKRMIIQKIQMKLIVEDARAAGAKVEGIVASAGGYIATSSSRKTQGQPTVSFTVRVPVDKLDSVLKQFRALALDVDSESVSGEDVTEEYVDVQARLRNEQAYEKELLELLAETRRRTGKAEDVLAVYNQVKETRGRIEQMQARSQYLEKMSSLATIDLELEPSALSQPIAVAGWHPTGTMRDAARTLVGALQGLVDIVIVLVIVVLPVTILIALPIWGLFRLYRHFRPRRAAPAPAAPTAA